MKKYFSSEIYKVSLKKIGLISALVGVLCVMITVAMIIFGFSGQISGRFIPLSHYTVFYNLRGYTAAGIAPMLIFILFVGAPVFTYMAFRYQNRRAEADKMHSLPYTTVQLFMSGIAAVLTVLSIIIILTTLFAWLAIAATGQAVMAKYVILSALGYMTGSALVAMITALAMSFTGTAFANFTVTAVILFLPRSILFLIGIIITNKLEGLINLSYINNIFLNPSTNIPTGIVLDLFNMWEYNGVSEILISGKSIIYTIILTLIYFAAALLSANRRKSELAGKSFGSNMMSYVFAAMCAAPVAAYFAFFSITEQNYDAGFAIKPAALLIVFAFIVFLIISLIYTAKPKDFLKASAVFVLVYIITAGTVCSALPITKLIASKEISEENVEYVKVNLSPEKMYINSPVYTYGIMQAKDIKIYDGTTISLLSESADYEAARLLNNIDIITNWDNPFKVWCEFHMANGKKIVRYIPIYDAQTAQSFTNAIVNNEEYYAALVSLPDNSEIAGYSVSEFYSSDYQNERELVFKSLFSELSSNAPITRTILPYYMRNYTSEWYSYLYAVGSVIIYGESGGDAFTNSLLIDNDTPATKLIYMKAINAQNESKLDEISYMIFNDMDNIYEIDMSIDLYNNDWATTDYHNTVYFSYYENNVVQNLTYEQLVQLFTDFADSDIENFKSGSCYAEINMHLIKNDNSDYMSLHSYIPISDSSYDYWIEIARNLYE